MIVANSPDLIPHPPAAGRPACPWRTPPAWWPADPPADAVAGYADRYAGVFTRADQGRQFRAYLAGLLAADGRSVAALAGPDPRRAQAVNHFVAHSPWDADRLTARYRQLVRPAGGLWAVHDVVIPKTGRHAVGTHRQFARRLGRKLNCQVAVAVGWVGPAGYLPLAVRLYLPGHWLRDNPAAAKTVPADRRGYRDKPDLAAGLIAEVLADIDPPAAVAAADGFAVPEFADRLAAMKLAAAAGDHAPEAVAAAAGGFGWLQAELGFDRYEGRTWVGWHHHAALVLASYGLLATGHP